MEHHGANGPSMPGRWWGSNGTTVANTDVMNQLCRVCGEPAAGFHFGAFTCEGCKSFFGRTYNNLGSVSECKNNGECVINKKNRTSCKACRLRKCLLVGMSKSGSRYGRRSNWFKIHCLLQEQQQQQHLRHQSQSIQTNPLHKPWMYPIKDSNTLLDIDNNNSVICPEPEVDTTAGLLLPRSGFVKPSNNFWPSGHNFLTVPSSPYFVTPFLQNTLNTLALHHRNTPQNYLLPYLPVGAAPLTLPSSLSPISVTSSQVNPTGKDLNKLTSLGPVQQQPIDLSTSAADSKDSSDASKNGQSSGKSQQTNSTSISLKPQISTIVTLSPLDLSGAKS